MPTSFESSGREKSNGRKISESHDEPRTDKKETKSRPTQESGGACRATYSRGNDLAGASSRPQVDPGTHGQGAWHQPRRYLQARKEKRPSAFYATKDRGGHGRKPVPGS